MNSLLLATIFLVVTINNHVYGKAEMDDGPVFSEEEDEMLIKLFDELRGSVESQDEYIDDIPSSEPSFGEAFRRSFSSHKDFLRAFKEDLDEHDRKRGATKCPLVSQEANCPGRKDSNGCGTEMFKKIPFAFRSTMTPSCNKHDICYGCGHTRRWTQKACDTQFKNDMYKKCVCKFIDSWWLVRKSATLACKATAFSMFKLVRWFGSVAISKKDRHYCHDSCILPYGSPTVALYPKIF